MMKVGTVRYMGMTKGRVTPDLVYRPDDLHAGG